MRFSIKTLMITVTLSSFYLAIVLALPSTIAITALWMVTLWAASASVAGVVYFRGARRAFCIGAFGPAAFLAFHLCLIAAFSAWDGPQDLEALFDDEAAPFAKVGFACAHATSLVGGFSGVLIRWLGRDEPPACPSPQ